MKYPVSRQVTRAEARQSLKPVAKPCGPGGRKFQRKKKFRGVTGFDLSKIKHPEKFLNSCVAKRQWIASGRP